MSGSEAKPAVSRPKGVTGKNLGVLSLALFAAALLLMAWAGYEMKRALETLDWPETQGTITSSGVSKEIRRESGAGSRQSITYYPEIRYAYQANGRSYTGTKINIGGKTGGMEWLAQRAVKKYSSGENVMVHYNPHDPAEAVLKAGIAGSSIFMLLMGVVFLAAGVSCFRAFLKNRNQQPMAA